MTGTHEEERALVARACPALAARGPAGGVLGHVSDLTEPCDLGDAFAAVAWRHEVAGLAQPGPGPPWRIDSRA